jgi:tripartite-type tricarboxylate transporter receptor subunit TctC
VTVSSAAKPFRTAGVFTAAVFTAAMLTVSGARAADFYSGKTLDIIVSTGVGGSLDANTRLIAQYLGKHIPGHPTVVVQNMPGAGHLRAAAYMYNEAPKDGTAIAAIVPIFILSQVLGDPAARFDASKFQWLGVTTSSNEMVYLWHTSPVNSVADAKTTQVLMGATGAGSHTVLYPTLMNNLLGTKFKLVSGYPSSNDIGLALERGEVAGRAGHSLDSIRSEHGDWLAQNKIKMIAQIGLGRDPQEADVPLLTELAKTPEDKEIMRLFSADVALGQPYLAPPGAPAERVAILRQALQDTLKDPDLVAQAKKMRFNIRPESGADVQQIVDDLVATPPATVADAKARSTEGAGKGGKS